MSDKRTFEIYILDYLFFIYLWMTSLPYLISLISSQDEVEAIPECEERKAHKESERTAELRYERYRRIDPGLLLRPDVRGHVVIAQHEQTAIHM